MVTYLLIGWRHYDVIGWRHRVSKGLKLLTQVIQDCQLIYYYYHLTFIQFKICCCVQNFMKIGWFFTEMWRYIDFQNGGRPLSWNCFTTPIRHHPRSLLLAAAACQISCQYDTHIWIYSYLSVSYIWLIMLIQAPKWGFWGTLDP